MQHLQSMVGRVTRCECFNGKTPTPSAFMNGSEFNRQKGFDLKAISHGKKETAIQGESRYHIYILL